jgi:hypothetical protein
MEGFTLKASVESEREGVKRRGNWEGSNIALL